MKLLPSLASKILPCFLAATALAALPAQAVVYQLLNRTDLPPGSFPQWGLTLAGLDGRTPPAFPVSEVKTWFYDFEDSRASGVTLTYDPTANEIVIAGSVYGGLLNAAGTDFDSDPAKAGVWDLNFRYSEGVTATTDPVSGDLLSLSVAWNRTSTVNGNNTGSIVNRNVGFVHNLFQDPSYSMGSNTFRFGETDGEIVGAGWLSLKPNNESPPPGFFQDFAFTAVLIPEPSSALLLGLGSLVLFRRRRI